MTRTVISTPNAPSAPGLPGGASAYSQAVVAGGLVFVSGQPPVDPGTGQIVGESIGEQTRQCLANIEAILVAAGSTMAKVVSVTFILRDSADFAGMNEEWARWFPTDPPARQGAKHPLDLPAMRISIAAVAEA